MLQERRGFTDQMGRKVEVPFPPKRIISLVPSQTELLFDLGLDAEVVGITKFCIHPDEWFRTKTRVGGTKTYEFDVIKQLQPDLIIGNKEEGDEQGMKQLMSQYPVWISDIVSVEGALEMISAVGAVVDRQVEAEEMVQQIISAWADIPKLPQPKRAAYFIWRKPYMIAGGGTFINDVMGRLGLQNVLGERGRYPQVELRELRELQPELILLSSEPYPFSEQHYREFTGAVPGAQVLLVDGESFSWYGSRMLRAEGYLKVLIRDL